MNSLQNAIQQHGDDHDTLCKVIIDIIVNNQMCMLFFYKFLNGDPIMYTSTQISSITIKWINYNVSWVQYLLIHWVNAQMKVDANLCDDGMEYIQTLTMVQRNIQVYLFRHARKSHVVLICAHLMMQISVITIYVNGYYTNNSHT